MAAQLWHLVSVKAPSSCSTWHALKDYFLLARGDFYQELSVRGAQQFHESQLAQSTDL